MAHIHLPDGAFSTVSDLLVDSGGRAHYDNYPHRAPAGHHGRAVQYHGDGGSIVCDLSGQTCRSPAETWLTTMRTPRG